MVVRPPETVAKKLRLRLRPHSLQTSYISLISLILGGQAVRHVHEGLHFNAQRGKSFDFLRVNIRRGRQSSSTATSPLEAKEIFTPDQVRRSTKAIRHESSPRYEEIIVGNQKYTYDCIYLRDACSCPRCVDPSTTQKLFETSTIPSDVGVKRKQLLSNGSLQIEWKNDIPGYEDHISQFSVQFFKDGKNYTTRLKASQNMAPCWKWNRRIMMERNLEINYREYMDSNSVLHAALKHLQLSGILFLRDVPSDPAAIGSIANRIGPIRNTFYGSTWDVRSVPSAKNVAYTARDLGFHMDLLYMADPPGLQLLHCIKASAQGGESLFSDGFNALATLRRLAPDLVYSLGTYSVTYRYKNNGQWYQYSRPSIEYDHVVVPDADAGTIQEGSQGNVAAINWSPPFQAPFEVDTGSSNFRGGRATESRLRQYVAAARRFKALVEDDDAIYETKMEAGTCVIFNNRRVLHARRAFSEDHGERWLRGAYLDTDVFRSRLRILNEGCPNTTGEQGQEPWSDAG
ncbi:hypothetical protein MMC06_002032 [Schaereria dolodes]|nr:hypothetical protein [Schaereria dolodes]